MSKIDVYANYNDRDMTINELDTKKVQMRPDMYIGYRGWKGNLHIMKEILQNALDEAGIKDTIASGVILIYDVKLNKFSINDDGRGIPLKSLYKMCTLLNSTGKLVRGENKAYKFASGKNGVGMTVTNALASSFNVKCMRQGEFLEYKFENGDLLNERSGKSSKHGTEVDFIPNKKIFGELIDYNPEDVFSMCETFSYLYPNIKIVCSVIDEDGDVRTEKYKSKNGLYDLLDKIVPKSKRLIEPIHIKYTEEEKEIEVLITYQPTLEQKDLILSFANYCTTIDHGTHVEGFNAGFYPILKAVRESFNKKEQEELKLSMDDMRDSMVAIVVANHTDAEYVGQVKEKLQNHDMIQFCREATKRGLVKWLNKADKNQVKKLTDFLKKVIKMKNKAISEKKNMIKTNFSSNPLDDNGFISNKYANATWSDDNFPGLEIVIVEGDSAGTIAKRARDKRFQEVLSNKGVPQKGYELPYLALKENECYNNYIKILNTGIGPSYDPKKCRVGKIIILSDADIDGDFIASLLSSTTIYHFRELVAMGLLYRALPPLYCVTEGNKKIYLADNNDYSAYVQEKIANKIVLSYDGIKLSKEEIKKFLVINMNYEKIATRVSKRVCSDPVYLEHILLHIDKPFIKFKKAIQNLSEDIKITKNEEGSIILEGIFNDEHQINVIDDNFKRHAKEFYELIHVNNSGNIYIELNGKRKTLYEVMENISKYTPTIRRFKGLGEMNADELWNTSLDPKKRKLIRLTSEDLERDIERFALLHSDKKKFVAERKKLIESFQINFDDIDT